MVYDKLKIRISPFVGRIIENDAQAFGFVKTDGTSNKNGLLNKLLPQMERVRQEQREEANKLLQDKFGESEDLLRIVNELLTDVVFEEEELSYLADEIWIRPSKGAATDFDEMISQLEVLSCDLTSYVRGLLNEYARFPQYKRQSVVFKEERDMLKEAVDKGNLISFRYDGEYCKIFAYNYIYGYLIDQNNYIIAYDVERNLIRSLALCKVERPKSFLKRYKPTAKLLEELRCFEDSYEYDEYKSIPFKEVQ